MRKSPEMLLWWLWIVGTIGMLLAVDFYRNTLLIGILRYSFILSPAIFIILATFLPQHWLGRSVSYAALLGAILYGLDRLEVGPDPNEDWQTLARITNRLAGPGDIIAFAGSYDYEPGFNYVVMAHYMPKWTCPIMFLTNEPSDAVLRQLAAHGRIWIIGHNPTSETGRYLPGWTTGDMHGGGAIGELIWAASPPATATEK
jgi:drug/metabolite transporter superfamily protein YnfA